MYGLVLTSSIVKLLMGRVPPGATAVEALIFIGASPELYMALDIRYVRVSGVVVITLYGETSPENGA